MHGSAFYGCGEVAKPLPARRFRVSHLKRRLCSRRNEADLQHVYSSYTAKGEDANPPTQALVPNAGKITRFESMAEDVRRTSEHTEHRSYWVIHLTCRNGAITLG